MKIAKKAHILLLTAMGFAVYFTSYLTRVGFNTMMIEISKAEGYAETQLSLAITAAFITYGLGQLFSGYLGDRFNPTRIIIIGLSVSAAINFSMPFAPNPTVMALLWGLNGLAQSFVYPPTIKTMSTYLTAENYPNAIMTVAIAGNIGTLAVSLLSPLIISLSGWRTAFLCFGGFAVAVIVAWTVYSTCLQKKYGPVEAPARTGDTSGGGSMGFLKPALACGLILVMIFIFMQGFLKDGVNTWMAPYISDVFKMSSEKSILSTMLFPIISACSIFLTTFLRKNVIRSELLLAMIYFFTFLVCLGLLVILRDYYLPSVILLTLMTVTMTAANYVTITFVPIRFAKYGRVSTMVGMLNSCTFVGSALSAVGLAYVKTGLGWNAVFILWAALAVIGISAAIFPMLRLKKSESDK